MLRLLVRLIPEAILNRRFMLAYTVHPVPFLVLCPHPNVQEGRNNHHAAVADTQPRKCREVSRRLSCKEQIRPSNVARCVEDEP